MEVVCPKGDLGLVFPNGIGKVESYANLIDRGFGPIQIAAGVVIQKPALDDDGEPTMVAVAKYGLHAYATPARPYGSNKATTRSKSRS